MCRFHEHMRAAEKKGCSPRGDSLERPAKSIKKLPPTLIISAEIDPLVDQASGTGTLGALACSTDKL